jgi:hypothetical protein
MTPMPLSPLPRTTANLAAAVMAATLAFALGCKNRQAAPAPPPVAHSSHVTKPVAASSDPDVLLKGQAALGDFTTDAPGVRRLLTTADLAEPYETNDRRRRLGASGGRCRSG